MSLLPARPPAHPHTLHALRRRGACAWALVWAALAPLAALTPLVAQGAQGAQTACVDEDQPEPAVASLAAAATAAAQAAPVSPRTHLQNLVRDAQLRSNAIGASRLLAEAAEQDVEEAKANKKPQASLFGAMSPSLGAGKDATTAQLQGRAGVELRQTIYDGGRSDRLVDWRAQQAEAARLGFLSTREQVTLTTASLAFERSRFRMQAVIYGQNMRKMACLVEALQTIVNADKGRASELVQARKQLQQAELLQVQAQSQARAAEAKLRRLVGDGLPGTEGMSTLLLGVPDLTQVLNAAERATDITQLDANAAALREIARVVESGNKPQLSWNIAGNANVGVGGGNPHNTGMVAGLTLNIPLLNPALEYSSQAARKRAEAALLQRAEALEQRRIRIVDMHEQANAAFERVRRVALVLRDSDRLRNFTLQQWQQMGRRSLFDVIGAENDHYNLRVQYINALHDGQQMNATLTSLGPGLSAWLQ